MRSFITILLVLFLLSPTSARAARPVEDDVRELLKVTGVEQQMRQMGTTMADALKPIAQNVPPSLWEELFSDESLQVVIERMIPVYVETYSPKDIRALLAFYRSPVGQRLVATTPTIQKRAFAIGQQWGQEVGMRVAQEAAKARATAP